MRINGQIDVAKVTARIKELEAEIKSGKRGCKEEQREASKAGLYCSISSPKKWVWNEIHEATQLYSLRAHMRGRLHMKKRRVMAYTGTVSYEEWDLEKQFALVEPIIDRYLVKEEEEQAA